MDGILPVYKPVGLSSYDVIRTFKQNNPPPDGLRHWKVGHGGTLDPFAEGVLLLLLGRATKKMNELAALPKTYIATARVGASSDTLDCTGVIVPNSSSSKVQEAQLQAILPKFTGEITQRVPDFSAAKLDGKPRYEYARAGLLLATKTKMVVVHKLQLLGIAGETVTIEATVSSGTYIRQLSYDLLQAVGVESYLTKLVRKQIGAIGIAQCATLAQLQQRDWVKFLLA